MCLRFSRELYHHRYALHEHWNSFECSFNVSGRWTKYTLHVLCKKLFLFTLYCHFALAHFQCGCKKLLYVDVVRRFTLVSNVFVCVSVSAQEPGGDQLLAAAAAAPGCTEPQPVTPAVPGLLTPAAQCFPLVLVTYVEL